MTHVRAMAGLMLLCWGLGASAANQAADARTAERDLREALRSAAVQVANGREAWAILKLAGDRSHALDRHRIAMLQDLVAAARDDDPVILRDVIVRDRHLRADPGQVAALVARLHAIDPDNAYNVLWEMTPAPSNVDESLTDARLQRMAQTTRYRDDYLPVLRAAHRALARGYGLDPAPASDTDDERIVDVMSAASGFAAAIAIPGFQPLYRACDAERFPQRGEVCRAIARRIAADGDTVLAQYQASALLRSAASDDAQRQEAAALSRDARWLSESLFETGFDAGNQPTPPSPHRRYFSTLLRAGELEAIRERLAEHGLPLSPPANWIADDAD